MSNYPAGVTGREYAIAGPDFEEDLEVTCGATAVTIARWSATTTSSLSAAIAALEHGSVGTAIGALRGLRGTCEEVDLDACPFEGVVTVQGYQGESWWECPLCGTEHTRDLREEAEDARADRLIDEARER